MNEELIKKLSDALSKINGKREETKKLVEKERRELVSSVGRDIVEAIKPALSQLVGMSKITKDDIKEALSSIKISTNIPDVVVPPIEVPKAQVDVRVPKVEISDIVQKIKMPDEMNIKGWVQLMGVDLSHPLPVQLRDKDGKPVNLFESLTTLVSQGGGGGGKHDYFTIKGFSQSAYSEVTNPDGRLRVSVETEGSGLTDAELRASSVPVEQVSGSIWSMYIAGSTGTMASYLLDADGIYRDVLPVEGTVAVSGVTNSISSALVDSSGVQYSGSNPLPVVITSGAAATTAVQNLDGDGNYRGTFPVEGTVLVSDITASVKSALIDSSGIQYSGSNPVPVGGSVSVSGVITSTGAYLLNGDGLYRGTLPVEGTVAVSGITNSVASSLIDSSGVQYSGSNPVPITVVSGALTSMVAVGAVVSDAVDDGSAPLKVGGIARTANPSAVAGGDVVSASYDDIGRQLTRPIQVRDLIATAYVALTSGSGYGTETTLLAGSSGVFNDLIYVMGSNTSDVAVTVDLRASTGGTVIMSLRIPANGTAGVSLTSPIPAPFADHTWTVDLPDETGGNVYVSALFSKEV